MKNTKLAMVVLLVAMTLVFGFTLVQAQTESAAPVDCVCECPTVPLAAAEEVVIAEPEAMEDEAADCGLTGTMTILLLGTEANNPPLGADLIRVAKVDFDTKTIEIKAYSRDEWVGDIRLGAAYDRALKDGKDAPAEMMSIMDRYFGVKADHYFAISIDEIGAVIDKLGGVKFFVPETIITDRNFHFLVGEINLDGKLASEYVRANEPYGDKGRMRRQDLFVEALKKRLSAEDTLPLVPEILDIIGDAMVTDMDGDQLGSLACVALTADAGAISFIK